MTINGRLELITSEFALGWVEVPQDGPGYLYAVLGAEVLGMGTADLVREDLQVAGAAGGFMARAFCVPFHRVVAAADVARIEVVALPIAEILPRKADIRIEEGPSRQVFVLGSPRSGTSEMGTTLTTQLALPWTGEGHVAQYFAAAAVSMRGDANSSHTMLRTMAGQGASQTAILEARITYYATHFSASFLDKTPGLAMIRAAPFLLECFPSAKFIFMKRNGIANVASRMRKFGGSFREHCDDWAATMDAWTDVKWELPQTLEVEQAEMLAAPARVAAALAAFLETPAAEAGLGLSLATGRREATGAGIGRTTLADVDWTEDEVAHFRRSCDAMMKRFGYY